ncbi:NADPH2:quinone reductase [Anseongella ginsenosidimutans]|uniref:NADPH2:quinone reductase n=1 Tax=Anseongella ginsenosidimutans TaxID=496056 RepID=A0A4R3KJZ7_9SPHI|nr:NAD(P)H-quinone oxidoreductase [Anseongella ginsenosidimutans]QEC53830.1 NAD(P)H-quinone oxidoreductase [Anseongella ginsenosidimutans]TCS83893.1 NADPH2:quinone reductase [Anseongella ginsenosidimutans]
MKAIIITQPGEPGVLQLAERPVPVPAAGEVLIKVKAAGLNRPDIAQRKGRYPAPEGAPADIPGLEIAGILESVAEKKDGAGGRWKAGDSVCALVSGGGYAEYCCVPEGQCLPLPENFSFAQAASLPETFFTVWSNVFDRGKLQKGDHFLVHGGSGGIGSTAIQMASVWGCQVFTTAGTPEKCRFCEELGASRAINYHVEDFEEVMKGLYPSPALSVILDMIGGEYTPKNLRLLADEGRLIQINAAKGKSATIDLLEIMRRRLVVTGSTLRARDSGFKSDIARKLEANIWPLLSEGLILPVVHAVFPLKEAARAHELMESGGHLGKIVLEMP